jgi:hypothetical protein
MRALLLALAAPIGALAVTGAPAAALDPPTATISAGGASGVTIHHGLPPQLTDGFRRDGPRRDRDRRRRDGDTVLIHDREYQGDTAWRANSYNDWWHDRPDRAYPRWMANNQDCQRLWWSGGGWRC